LEQIYQNEALPGEKIWLWYPVSTCRKL